MFAIVLHYLLLFGPVRAFLLDDDVETVNTPVGDIIGVTRTISYNSYLTYKVNHFLGIPYAEAPTGDLRFKRPVPRATFTPSFDARKEGPICYQYEVPSFVPASLERSEDCLRLNIFVPDEGSQGQDHRPLKPVMVFIHGGGFILGSANRFDGGMLAAYGDVIIVAMNYRLAHYGFLTTGDSTLPGNLGLWDQQLAFRWVHDNIHAFGGDANRVTVFGEDAGSASVIYHTFYPGNKGLFQHAIAESGSMMIPWGFTELKTAVQVARTFVNEEGCTQPSPIDYIACLKIKTIAELNATVNRILAGNISPVVDGEFILDDPKHLLSGRTNATDALDMFHSVDLMIGFNNKDGLVDLGTWMGMFNITDPANFTVSRDSFEKVLVPTYLNAITPTEDVTLLTIHEYTDWSDPNDDQKRLI